MGVVGQSEDLAGVNGAAKTARGGSTSRRYEVGPVAEIKPGERKIVYPRGGAGIGVFNVDNEFYAIKNVCPHMGAPLCVGKLTGTTAPTRTADGRVGMEW